MDRLILLILLSIFCEEDNDDIVEEKNYTLPFVLIGSGIALIFILGTIIMIMYFRNRRRRVPQSQLSDIDLNIADDEQLRNKIRFGK